MQLIDTHCHLYLNEFDNDRYEVMSRAKNAGVTKFYLPSIDSTTMDVMMKMEGDYQNECFAMIGLHPCSVNESYLDELQKVDQWLQQRKFVALGEIGLDFYWDKTFTNEQYAAFNQQMEWALAYNLPIVIHTRQAMQETIDAVKPFAKKGLTGIFHCFGDSLEAAQQIISLGFLLGVGGVITYKNAGLAPVLEAIPLEHMVLETDAPYLSPVPHRGKRNESSYIFAIAQKLAEIKNVSVEEVALVTTSNAEKIFNA
ncbi:MAG: TatD family hydrolase [Chitinophagaceae bacterium]|nr:TatD family hydrolase [Chitinophagaceae bacterium]